MIKKLNSNFLQEASKIELLNNRQGKEDQLADSYVSVLNRLSKGTVKENFDSKLYILHLLKNPENVSSMEKATTYYDPMSSGSDEDHLTLDVAVSSNANAVKAALDINLETCEDFQEVTYLADILLKFIPNASLKDLGLMLNNTEDITFIKNICNKFPEFKETLHELVSIRHSIQYLMKL